MNEYVKSLNEIKEPINLIIPASMPFEGVVAASIFITRNKSKTKMIPYLFDQFVDNKLLHRFLINMRLKWKNHIRLEKSTLKNADSILIMKQLKEHFISNFEDYDKKFKVVEHPLLREYPGIFTKESDNIKIVYAGSFYKSIRNPDYFLKVVERALIHLKGNLDLYSFGNCDKVINKYSSRNKSITNYGRVSTEKSYEAIMNANILVAVGNSDNSQIPSKLFEYLSFGKPIVYFYSNDTDVNLKILKEYTLSLCLKQDPVIFNENVNKFDKFCKNNLNSHVPFEEVERIYNNATPKYTADLIIQLMTKDFIYQ